MPEVPSWSQLLNAVEQNNENELRDLCHQLPEGKQLPRCPSDDGLTLLHYARSTPVLHILSRNDTSMWQAKKNTDVWEVMSYFCECEPKTETPIENIVLYCDDVETIQNAVALAKMHNAYDTCSMLCASHCATLDVVKLVINIDQQSNFGSLSRTTLNDCTDFLEAGLRNKASAVSDFVISYMTPAAIENWVAGCSFWNTAQRNALAYLSCITYPACILRTDTKCPWCRVRARCQFTRHCELVFEHHCGFLSSRVESNACSGSLLHRCEHA